MGPSMTKKILALIPARSGSKGIRNKNLLSFNGLTLLERAVQTASRSSYDLFTVVSTDSEYYANTAISYGAHVPRLRPSQLSTDNANSHDVWQSELLFCENHFSCQFDISVLLEPTCPLRISEDIDQSIDLLLSDATAKAVATVSPIHGNHTPHKAHISCNGFLQYFHPRGSSYHTRQNITTDFYWRNGACYATTRHNLLHSTTIFTDSCRFITLNRPMISVDSLDDARLAALVESAYSKDTWDSSIRCS